MKEKFGVLGFFTYLCNRNKHQDIMDNKKMHITASQDAIISLALGRRDRKPYNREKSWIVAEAGGPQMAENGREWFIGSFIAHLWHRGTYRFDTKFERIGNHQYVSCDHKKVK